MEDTPSPALLYAESASFSHDISHCNPDIKTEKCYECLRYAADLQLGLYEDKFKDGLYSYFSEPIKSCQEKEYQHFIQIYKIGKKTKKK